ncbi:MAG: TadE/TadG family type IV pilus assembly protein [candidate division WOR-3 bacterium]
MRCPRLIQDTEGGALLETVIVLPVLLLFMMVIMELSLLVSAKQVANYAAFCAARTCAVYGTDSTSKIHLAAALATSSISTGTPANAMAILSAYGLPDPDQAMQALRNIPGFGDNTLWHTRLADACLRTGFPTCDTGTVPGKARKHVTVNLTYVYRCSFLPLGSFWGGVALNSFITMLKSLPFYALIEPAVTRLENSRPWYVPLHGRAVVDYWAG